MHALALLPIHRHGDDHGRSSGLTALSCAAGCRDHLPVDGRQDHEVSLGDCICQPHSARLRPRPFSSFRFAGFTSARDGDRLSSPPRLVATHCHGRRVEPPAPRRSRAFTFIVQGQFSCPDLPHQLDCQVTNGAEVFHVTRLSGGVADDATQAREAEHEVPEIRVSGTRHDR